MALPGASTRNSSVGLQSGVEPFGGIRKGRGAFMDATAIPLNDAPFLVNRLRNICQLTNAKEKLAAIQRLLCRGNAVAGSIYSKFGVVTGPHCILNIDSRAAPGHLDGSVRRTFGFRARGTEHTHHRSHRLRRSSDWLSGVGPVGIDRRDELGQPVGLNVQSQMHPCKSSAYMRFHFHISDSLSPEVLKLSLKCDDGYVAYLNGVEVARRHSSDELTWNARVTDNHLTVEAI